MKQFIFVLRLLGGILIVIALINFYLSFVASQTTATIGVSATDVPKQATALPAQAQPTPQIALPTPTPLPNPIQGYNLANTVDLSSGLSTTWSIRLPDGGELPGTWARAIPFKAGDDSLKVDPFDPHAGTIYSLLGDTTVVRAHSGQTFYKWNLFASNLDLYLRKNADKSNMTLSQGIEKLVRLWNSTAYFCQTTQAMEPLSAFDPAKGCPGKKLELRLIAAALVPQPRVAEYDAALLNLRSYMATAYPGTGFEMLRASDGFILVTCVQRYPDQPQVAGVEDWYYNRLVLGFQIVGN